MFGEVSEAWLDDLNLSLYGNNDAKDEFRATKISWEMLFFSEPNTFSQNDPQLLLFKAHSDKRAAIKALY